MTETTQHLTTPPDDSGARVTTKLIAWFRWADPEKAPKFKRRYSQRDARWHSIHAAVDLLDDGSLPRNNVKVECTGQYYKQDGTLGKHQSTQRYYGLDELPHEELRDLIWVKLHAELAEWEARR